MKNGQRKSKKELQQNIRKTKVITKRRTANVRVDAEDIEVIDSICFLGSIINIKGSSSQDMLHRLVLGRARMNDLEMIFQSTDVPTKFRTAHAVAFSVTLCGCES